MGPPDPDVVEPPVVAQGELAPRIDSVVAEAVAARRRRQPGMGLGPGGEDLGGGASFQRAVRAGGVVVLDEAVDLGLEGAQRPRSGLTAQVLLHRLVEPLDLPAGLGVIGPGVLEVDAQRGELGLEGSDTEAVGGGEDGPVVREDGRRGGSRGSAAGLFGARQSSSRILPARRESCA